jgi:hypothetical protein
MRFGLGSLKILWPGSYTLHFFDETGFEESRHLPKSRLFPKIVPHPYRGGRIMGSVAKKQRLVGSREQIKCATLEVAIATAVRRSDPRCGRFIGVFIERRNPKSGDEPNWIVRGSSLEKQSGITATMLCPLSLSDSSESLKISD